MASSKVEDAISASEGDDGKRRQSTIGEQRTILYGAIMRKDFERTAELLATIPPDDLKRMRSGDHTQGQLSILHAAVETGSVEIVELLLDKGFVPTAKDKAGRSPLDIAKTSNNEDMVKVITNSCEVSDANNTKNSKENMVHKTSADSGVSSSSENTTSSDIRSNGEETAMAVPDLSPDNMTLPISTAVPMATPSAEPDVEVDTSTRDAVFAFLKRRLSNKYWKDFFKVLGFQNKDIMDLKFHFINISLEECIVQGLQSWDKKNGDIGILFGALCHETVNQRILVDDLKRRFSKLRPIAIKPIKSQADLEKAAQVAMENSNGFSGHHERTPSTKRGDHTPSPGFKRKKPGSLFDKLPFRKMSTATPAADDIVLGFEPKKSKNRRSSVDESKNLRNRADFFSFRRGSQDDKSPGGTAQNNGSIEKTNLSKISETNVPDGSVVDEPQWPSSVQYVEADVHTEMANDESERQSLASTSTTRRSSGDTSLVIHESGSEGNSTPSSQSPRLSKKKKKDKRSSNSSSIFTKISIPSPSIFRKFSSPNSPSPPTQRKPAKTYEKRRRMGHVTPVSDAFQFRSDNECAPALLPSSDRLPYNGQFTAAGESTSEEGSEGQSSRKDSSETQVSVQTESSLELHGESEIDDATRHLLDAGKSIELLLNSFNLSEDTDGEYKTTSVYKSSIVVELIENSKAHQTHLTRPARRQRSYSDSDIKMQRIVKKTKMGTYRMDFYFKERATSSRNLTVDLPNIRQNPMRRHSAQTYSQNDICESVWQPRSAAKPKAKKVIMWDVGQEKSVGRSQKDVVDLSTTI